MLEEIKCIICDHSVIKKFENIEGYQEGENFTIYHCLFCDTSFAWPHIINEKIYDHIYRQVSVVPGYNRYVAYANEIISKEDSLDYLADEEATYFGIKGVLEENNNKTAKLLEVGSGLGYLTYAINQKGYDIIGLDISSDAVKQAERQFGNYYVCQDVYQYAIHNSGKFDMVILTEVLEHVPDPKGFCDALISLLKVGGKLVITTPNKSVFSPDELWETELPPIHLTWFSETSFKAIAQQKNLSLSFFDFTNFNKTHIDITRFIFYNHFYKIKKRMHVLDKNGKVITPLSLREIKGIKEKLKSTLKKFLKPFFIRFLTHKKNMNRNNVLCVILKKKE
ncbi:MAG: class I SAM-dependent methyltransferase [Ginsengibacter sp.]